MSESHSVTNWLEQLKNGNSEACRNLWNRFYTALVRHALVKLGPSNRRVADEEDIATIAFTQFYSGVDKGIFPQLDDRDDLWRILLSFVDRRVVDQIRYNTAGKRGRGETLTESAFDNGSVDSRRNGAGEVVDCEPTPEFVAATTEEISRLLGMLSDNTEREIAIARMMGYKVSEIPAQLDISLRAVERKIRLIKQTWQQERNEFFRQ